MSKYYPDEEFPTFCDPETHEAFRQFAENGGAALLKNCNFRLKTSKMKIIGSKLRSRN